MNQILLDRASDAGPDTARRFRASSCGKRIGISVGLFGSAVPLMIRRCVGACEVTFVPIVMPELAIREAASGP